MVFNKKAITPVVATALLLVVAVVAVVGFQTWFNTYQSGLNTKVEQQSATGVAITVERLEASQVYLKNAGTTDINSSSITVDGKPCISNVTTITSKVNNYSFNASVCNTSTLIKGTAYDVVVVTDSGVFSSNQILR